MEMGEKRSKYSCLRSSGSKYSKTLNRVNPMEREIFL